MKRNRTHAKIVIILSICLPKPCHYVLFHSDLENAESGSGLESGVFWGKLPPQAGLRPSRVTLLGFIPSCFIKCMSSSSDVPGTTPFSLLRDRTHTIPADPESSTFSLPMLSFSPTYCRFISFPLILFLVERGAVAHHQPYNNP